MVHSALYARANVYAQPYNQQVRRIFTAVPTLTFTTLAEANPKRRWCTIVNVAASAADLSVLIATGQVDLLNTTYGIITLPPGGSVTFSRYGDMPWCGPIYGIGSGGTATVHGAEVIDY